MGDVATEQRDLGGDAQEPMPVVFVEVGHTT